MKYKNLLVLIAIVVSGTALQSQSWFENNPQWVNNYFAGFAGYGFEYVSISGDTVVQGKPAKVFKRFRDMNIIPDNTDFRIVRQNGDTIWCWNNTQNQFFVNYNFSLGVGDSVVVPHYWDNNLSLTYVIENTGSVFIADQSLRFQSVNVMSGFNTLKCAALIVEKIGMLNGECINPDDNSKYIDGHHFFLDEGNMAIIDGPAWHLCRFQNDKGKYVASGSNCDALTGTDDPGDDNAVFRLAPNPFGDQLSVVSPNGEAISRVRLFDCSGKLLKSVSTPENGVVATGELPAGLYFIEVISGQQQRSFLKAVKQ